MDSINTFDNLSKHLLFGIECRIEGIEHAIRNNVFPSICSYAPVDARLSHYDITQANVRMRQDLQYLRDLIGQDFIKAHEYVETVHRFQSIVNSIYLEDLAPKTIEEYNNLQRVVELTIES